MRYGYDSWIADPDGILNYTIDVRSYLIPVWQWSAQILVIPPHSLPDHLIHLDMVGFQQLPQGHPADPQETGGLGLLSPRGGNGLHQALPLVRGPGPRLRPAAPGLPARPLPAGGCPAMPR